MTDCPFTLNADGLWQCPNEGCGWVYPKKSDKPPRRNCPATRTPEAIAEQKAQAERQQTEAIELGKSLGWTAKDAKKWAAALYKWNKAGRPKRTDEEVAAIVVICEACEEYKADEKRCRICRCGVSTGGMAIFNKAKISTERCPQDKW